MFRRRLPVIIVTAVGLLMGIAIAGLPNQSRAPVISVPVSVASTSTTTAPVSTP